MTIKLDYESISVELIPLYMSDVITASGAFDGEDDEIGDWGK